jgi:hypothetical protein
MPLIVTTRGEMDESELVKREGTIDNDDEVTTWVEYYLGEELVHRSAHVTLKKWPEGLGAIAADFGQ